MASVARHRATGSHESTPACPSRLRRRRRARQDARAGTPAGAGRVEALEARQLFASVGPDGFGYQAFDLPLQSINLAPGGPGVVNITALDGADEATASIPLGAHKLRLYGVEYTGDNKLFLNPNGLITFDSATSGTDAYANTNLTGVPTQRTIAVMWDDHVTNKNAADTVLYRIDDADGNGAADRLVIEWNEVFTFGTNDPITFQAILQLNPPGTTQSEIILNFPDLNTGNSTFDHGGSATVGIKDAGTQGLNRLLVSQNSSTSPFVGTGKAVQIIRTADYGSVAGQAFHDVNANGTKDGGEAVRVGVTVYLDTDNDGTRDAGERTVVTDASGNYKFMGLAAGTHNVRQEVPAGWQGTAPAGGVHAVTVAAGQAVTGKDFGSRMAPGEIRGMKWNDVDGDGTRDAGEPGLTGWTIYLDADRDGTLDAGEVSTLTGAGGAFAFTNVPPGEHVVAEVQQAGWEQTFPGGGGAGAKAAAGGAGGESDDVAAAIARASDLSNYTAAELASAKRWVVGVNPGNNVRDVRTRVGGAKATAAKKLRDAHVIDFAKTVGGDKIVERLKGDRGVKFFYPLIKRQMHKRFAANDTLFPEQWHLKNTGQNGGTAGQDANVQPAWLNEFTGAGVTIGIVDDGLQRTHPDLVDNYVGADSYDFNFNDSDPSPDDGSDPHGTAVAGVAAGRGGNNAGISGAAPHASLAGLRLIALPNDDQQEADALSYRNQVIDIYSNSWGPADNGVLAGPGPQALAAMRDGVMNGRNNLGNIYTWAGGNGKQSLDNVNYDGYANSRYTIAVGAIDHNGVQSSYSEPGAALHVTAYSDGNVSGITTTDLVGPDGYNGPASPPDENYTDDFGGTSSATPLVSGVIALMLDANPNLTWRDVKHILANTARQNDLSGGGWQTNGGGFNVSHKYGFGAIDAGAAVAAAQTWRRVAPERSATSGLVTVNAAIPDNSTNGPTSTATISDDIRIETVEVVFSATHPYRGDLKVVLTSPDGTQSVLSELRNDSGDDYSSWVFSSTQHWGEEATGAWTLKVTDELGADVGTFDSWKLNVYGTPVNTSVHYVSVASGQIVNDINFGSRNVAPPEADIVDVTPDPRATPVETVTINFTEEVSGLNLADLTLKRNGGGNLLTGAQTLTTTDNKTFTLGGLTGLTGVSGSYVLTLTASGSGIVDGSGTALTVDAADTWTVTNAAPHVTAVFVGGTGWVAGFNNFLASSGAGEAAFGFRISDADQLNELPWTNLNRVSVRFNEAVNVDATDLVIRGIRVATYALAATNGFAYDAATFTASWTLAASLANERLMLDLDADSVTDSSANLLDGEWTDPTGTNVSGEAFPSGNGTAGGDFRFRLHVLPGDVNRNGNIQGNDVTLVRNAQGATPGGALYTIFKDVNGSANIQGNDVTLVRNRQGTTVPAGTFARDAGTLAMRAAAMPPGTRGPTVFSISAAPAPLRAVDLEPLRRKDDITRAHGE